jgi:phosphatidylglycerophosphatase A
MREKAALALATWFGCGFVPKGPGTIGALGGLALAWSLVSLAGWQPWYFGVLALAMTPAGVWSASVTAEKKQIEDPQIVVFDEVLGQWIALAGAFPLNGKSWIAAFLLFRIFDIAKPFPVRNLEKLPRGWGIIADDLMAGVYAALVLFGAGCFNLY